MKNAKIAAKTISNTDPIFPPIIPYWVSISLASGDRRRLVKVCVFVVVHSGSFSGVTGSVLGSCVFRRSHPLGYIMICQYISSYTVDIIAKSAYTKSTMKMFHPFVRFLMTRNSAAYTRTVLPIKMKDIFGV